jgi:DNA-binding NtrC family response regulator
VATPHSPPKSLLAVVELGGYPDFTPLYRSVGLEVQTANTLRKALALSRKQPPDLVIAEFRYGPTYGSQISNLESLMAGLQRDNPTAKLIVLAELERLEQLDKLRSHYPIFETLVFPIDELKLMAALTRAL